MREGNFVWIHIALNEICHNNHNNCWLFHQWIWFLSIIFTFFIKLFLLYKCFIQFFFLCSRIKKGIADDSFQLNKYCFFYMTLVHSRIQHCLAKCFYNVRFTRIDEWEGEKILMSKQVNKWKTRKKPPYSTIFFLNTIFHVEKRVKLKCEMIIKILDLVDEPLI